MGTSHTRIALGCRGCDTSWSRPVTSSYQLEESRGFPLRHAQLRPQRTRPAGQRTGPDFVGLSTPGRRVVVRYAQRDRCRAGFLQMSAIPRDTSAPIGAEFGGTHVAEPATPVLASGVRLRPLLAILTAFWVYVTLSNTLCA